MAGSGGNFAVRRDVWSGLGGFDERLGAGSTGQAAEDMDFIYRMLAAGETILYEPRAVIYHERQDLRGGSRRAGPTATAWALRAGSGSGWATSTRSGCSAAGCCGARVGCLPQSERAKNRRPPNTA